MGWLTKRFVYWLAEAEATYMRNYRRALYWAYKRDSLHHSHEAHKNRHRQNEWTLTP